MRKMFNNILLEGCIGDPVAEDRNGERRLSFTLVHLVSIPTHEDYSLQMPILVTGPMAKCAERLLETGQTCTVCGRLCMGQEDKFYIRASYIELKERGAVFSIPEDCEHVKGSYSQGVIYETSVQRADALDRPHIWPLS